MLEKRLNEGVRAADTSGARVETETRAFRGRRKNADARRLGHLVGL